MSVGVETKVESQPSSSLNSRRIITRKICGGFLRGGEKCGEYT